MGKKSKKKRPAVDGMKQAPKGTPTVKANEIVGLYGHSPSHKADIDDFYASLAADTKNPQAIRLWRLMTKKEKTVQELLEVTMEFVKFKKDDKVKWNTARVNSFYDYHSLLFMQVDVFEYGNPKPATETDKKFLKEIIRSADTEPAFIVAHALYLYGWIEFKTESNEEAWFRSLNNVIEACGEAKEEEKSRLLPCRYERPRTVGEYLSMLQETVENTLNKMRNSGVFAKRDPDKTISEVSVIVPGDRCDCCCSQEKSIHEMRVCGQCQVTYYCTEECHNKHRQDVHHKLCHKKGEFRSGDVVKTLEPFGSVPFGGFCRIVAPANKQNKAGDLWLVSDTKGEEIYIISDDKLLVHSFDVGGFTGEEEIEVLERILKGYGKAAENVKEDSCPPETFSAVDLYVMSLEEVD